MSGTPLRTPRPAASWTVSALPVDDPVAVGLLRAYLVDVADRYYRLHEGRDATAAEIERALSEMNSDDLAPPDGVFLMARRDGAGGPAGCAGLRRRDAHTVELKRVYIEPGSRGLGGGAALLAAVEAAASGLGARRIVLDTRLDLVEARALYARHGYRDVAPFGDGTYAEVWMAKELG
ncbi:GNAT family N-acetyltransferase [Streptomyces cucumeris]|uniref:GNAT family N-acetyltransferase n=1 Tax=Streptomyces cucumeris TaxID=2962890 RepID=UPI0020C8AB23|nr:GNAT family N-acetyltransferase [Streptomyces sp. NEAU-Y11]MCP9212602.1 GNAT family N-acetyltransferase [Streptomyces sp. NEAU-Y11]